MITSLSTIFSGCSNGWSVGGYELTPHDTTNYSFIEVLSQDSTKHWYGEQDYADFNWCFLHYQWEDAVGDNAK